ncbi:hypothetical protein CAPTEDRAFT_154791 [Capitella teleta]|uniref:Mitochondrial import inner membrane translocase subunit n=1 Tax=Capitella teleta TaxID=283909 RepID=R7TWR3_CAPTE|nr:hypothetical protein CAPTEDRAFT_154791 [Capitella teleta]|eukprot:ELT98052.1 hypothetical protein CAPTEDRAFT_154791 [Capitella teleta]
MSGTPQMDDQTAATMNQFKEFLLSYNKVSEACFTDCAHDFTSRKVLESESSCALNCMEKYLKVTQRISQRFQEFQMQSSDNSIIQKIQ